MKTKSLMIGGRTVSENNRPYFIADIAANHDGSIERAFELIKLAKESGADCAKFQNFKAPKIVSKSGFESIGQKLSHQKDWGKPVFEVYQDFSIPDDWTSKLWKKCNEVGIDYMTTPYDFESVDSTYPYLDAYKVGSGDITWTAFLEYIAKKDKPVLLSTGASSLEDVVRAANLVLKNNSSLAIMQCNTNYTAEPENFKHINLKVLNLYKKMFPQCILGLSDHTLGHSTALGAIALGARIIEKHFTDDNSRPGPDHKFAMNPESWRTMIDKSNELFFALGKGEKRVEANEKESYLIQRRCLYYKDNFQNGHIVSEDDLIALRPLKQDGIHPYEISDVAGKKLKNNVKEDHYVRWGDFYY